METNTSNIINTLVVCAFRYALGRSTYVVSEIADIIINYKSLLTIETKDLIRKEIDNALEMDQVRMVMDKIIWENVLTELGE